VRYISALDMHFDSNMFGSIIRIILFTLILNLSIFYDIASTELIDRVVAIVGDDVILYSELKEALREARVKGEDLTEDEMLERLINRRLILIEARKFRIGTKKYYRDTEDEARLIDDYITNRIRVMIQVSFDEIEAYYNDHREEFSNKGLYEVWNEIEDILKTQKLNETLERYIQGLKQSTYIRRQLH